jgi:DNA primase
MALIARASIDQVREAADIVELVGQRTQLRRVGTRWVGRCPFHDERTPSFSVNADLKTYYCFGCRAGGDVFRFVQETEGLDFVGAIEALADRYRIPLEYEEGGRRDEGDRRRRERLLDLLDAAARFYERHLWESAAGEAARAYLGERGLRDEIVRALRLGLSPGGTLLPRKAAERGFTREELTAVGLVNRRGNDWFAGRLVFPLADSRGRVVGFGARRLRDDDPIQAKYINTPETEVFRKGAIVYGLDRARPAIAKEGRALVVEGYTDVLALHQEGTVTAVASMGTALTESQLRELRRLCSEVYLCFDADKAGEEATLRGMELAVAQGFDVRVVALPQGVDPADAPAAFEERLSSAEGFPVHRVRLELERARSRQEAFERVRQVLARIDDSPDRMDAIRLAADRLGLPPETQAGLAPVSHRRSGEVSPRLLEAGDRLERDALAGCVANRGLVSLLRELGPEQFESELHRALRAHLVDAADADADVVALLAELDARASRDEIDERATKEMLLRLRERGLRRQLNAEPDLGRARELQSTLARVRDAIADLG